MDLKNNDNENDQIKNDPIEDAQRAQYEMLNEQQGMANSQDEQTQDMSTTEENPVQNTHDLNKDEPVQDIPHNPTEHQTVSAEEYERRMKQQKLFEEYEQQTKQSFQNNNEQSFHQNNTPQNNNQQSFYQGNSQQNNEPTTPYQTPVRQFQTYEQWQQSQRGVPPQSEFSSYEQWQRQQYNAQTNPQQGKMPKKKVRYKGFIIGVCSVIAAGILLASGIAIGSFMSYNGNTSVVITQQESSQAALTVDPNKPTVTITEDNAIIASTEDDGITGEAIYQKVSPSVVSVLSSSLVSQEQASGSGVVMSEDGYIITNHHVIDGAQKVTIVMSDGIQHNAEVVGSDEATDLAVLKITDAGDKVFQAAEFGDSTKILAGERAYAIGSPGGVELANTITTGSISAISRDITIDDRVMTLIQTDASINPGNSGGALINKYGQVIGITSAKLGISYYEGLGFAIPMDTAKEIVDDIIQFGYVPGRPSIGISGSNISKETAEYNNVPQGVLVHSVDSRTDAAAKGLQANDIIIGVNGVTITTMDEVNDAKGNLNAGDTMTLTVYRISSGKTFDVTIILSDEYDLQQQEVVTQEPAQQEQQNGYYFQIPW